MHTKSFRPSFVALGGSAGKEAPLRCSRVVVHVLCTGHICFLSSIQLLCVVDVIVGGIVYTLSCVCMYIYIYIYIYNCKLCSFMYVHLFMCSYYIYIYICIKTLYIATSAITFSARPPHVHVGDYY